MFHLFKGGKEKRSIAKEELEQAIAAFLEKHPNISYKVLVDHDYTVNYKALKEYLKVTPTNTFLITKETLEVFEDNEQNRELVKEIDAVQRAVDQYVRDRETFPVVEGDANRKICPMKLLPYLKKYLERDLYISEKHYLVTSYPDKKGKHRG